MRELCCRGASVAFPVKLDQSDEKKLHRNGGALDLDKKIEEHAESVERRLTASPLIRMLGRLGRFLEPGRETGYLSFSLS